MRSRIPVLLIVLCLAAPLAYATGEKEAPAAAIKLTWSTASVAIGNHGSR